MKSLNLDDREEIHAEIKTRMGVIDCGWPAVLESPLYPEIFKHAKFGNWGYVAILVTEVERGMDR